jgi:hypothetical protein
MDDASTATSATMSRKNAVSKGVVNLESSKPGVSLAQKKLTGIGLLMVNKNDV